MAKQERGNNPRAFFHPSTLSNIIAQNHRADAKRSAAGRQGRRAAAAKRQP